MKKIIFLSLIVFIFSINSANAEIFVDYVPPSLQQPQQPIVQQATQTQTKKVEPSPVIQTIQSSEKAPALPSHLKNDVNVSGTTQKIAKRTEHQVQAGTWFELTSSQYISDRTKKNTSVKFTIPKDETAGTILLPKGTIFKGHIEESHPAQLTSNGGLIRITIDEIIYQNISNNVKTTVLKVNGKNVHFNRIKGQRKFWKNTARNTRWGRQVCKKSYKTTARFSKKGGIYWILTPLPAIGGTLLLGGNAIVAPIVATFQKGEAVNFKAGTTFIIKITENSQIYVLDAN